MTNLKKCLHYLKGFGIELIALFIASVYLLGIPTTVQTGDTGELVSAAWGHFVPHPPGYPLYTWLQSFFLHIFNIGTVYWRASFVNVLFSVTCIYVLGAFLKENRVVAIGSMLVLAFSRVFWKYSLLPDVFILNALFAALIIAIYLKYESNSKRALWIPFLFYLGLANHLTLVFLLPLVFDVLLKQRKEKALYGVLALGGGVFISFYGSLILLNPESLSSWGNIGDLEDVVLHFLRMDYGTFKLVNSTESGSSLEIWKMLAEETLLSFYSFVILVIALAIKFYSSKIVLSRKSILLIFTLILYPLVFFSLSNMRMTGFLTEVIERFFILFHVLFVFGAGYAILVLSLKMSSKLRTSVGLVLIVCGMISFLKYRTENDYSKNTIIEDYVLNLLIEAPKSPTVLLVNSDTRFFAARYAQIVLGVRPEVKLLGHKMLFFPWFAEKFIKDTGLNVDAERIIKTNAINMEADVVLKNLDRYSFLTTLDFKNVEAYHIQFLPIGRLLAKGVGAGVYLGKEIPLSIRFNGNSLGLRNDRYSIFREIWSDYCNYPLFLGRLQSHNGSAAAAMATFESALREIPWCTPIAQELCELKKDPSCHQNIEQIRSKYFQYF